MKKRFLVSIGSVVVLALSFSGCGSSPQIQTPKIIKNDVLQEKTYTFPKVNPLDGYQFTTEDIKSIMRDSYKRNINLSTMIIGDTDKGSGFPTYYNKELHQYTTGPSIHSLGINVLDNKIELKIRKKNSFICDANINASLQYSITDTNDSYKVTIFSPYRIDFNADAFHEGFSGYKLCMPHGDEQYTLQFLNHLPDKLFKNKTFEFRGEINSEYQENSIIASFKRTLGNYQSNNIFDMHNKRGAYALVVDDITYPLYIKLEPYRNGTKITYFTDIKYELNSENLPTLSKDTLNKMHEKVRMVVNN